MFSLFRRKKTADPAPAMLDPAEAPAPAAPPGVGEAVHTTFVLSDAVDVPLDDLERQALAAGSQNDAADEPPEPADGAAPQGGFMSRWFGGGAAPAPVAPPVSVTAPPPAAPAVAPPIAPPSATNIEAARAELAPIIAEKDLELAPASATAEAARVGWMDRLKTGLKRTGSSISTVFTGTQIDDALYEDLETALLMADAGVPATEFLLQDAIADMLAPLEKTLVVGVYHPTVIMVAGVNGAGKTTSIGKLTKHLADAGASVLLAAAATFRAAAREQLAVWADRNAVEIITQQGADPSAVSFDAVGAGRARRKDVVLVDTAGRLPTQKHLMEELTKIRRVVTKADITAPHEVLLVIDGNTGQNALAQVKAFDEAAQLTGLIVTKLDGTAKGGVLCAIAREKPVPVYFVGVGEKLEDLQTFKAREFAQALVG